MVRRASQATRSTKPHRHQSSAVCQDGFAVHAINIFKEVLCLKCKLRVGCSAGFREREQKIRACSSAAETAASSARATLPRMNLFGENAAHRVPWVANINFEFISHCELAMDGDGGEEYKNYAKAG